ncbi:MAG TPA: cupin domain-containing protein [Burkholderiaceae bacterium]|nr:cupin domain-containing protein [Burkholderiaceae bacterium]
MNQQQVPLHAARVIRGGEPYRSAQGSVYSPGVSAQTAGSKSLFLGMVTLQPGERTRAHIHDQHESAFYVLSGEDVELRSGPRLEHRSVAQAGDYLFIPAGVPHVAVNRSATQPAVFIGARNEPTAQESVTMTPQLDAHVE